MYSIYIDNQLLYSPNLVKGGYAITAGTITTGLNKAGELSFKMPPSNPRYNDIHLMTSTIVVKDEDQEIFRCRPVEVSRDFYNNKIVKCEGWLACLLDSVVRPYNSFGSVEAKLRTYIAQHNQQVDSDKQFIVQTVTVTDPNDYIVRASSDYPQTWHEIEDKLIKLLGGYIRYDRHTGTGEHADEYFNYIDYITDFGVTSDQVIEFGKNLLSFDEFLTAEDVYTVIIPLGARDQDTEQRLTIKSVNNNQDYLIDNDAAAIFGKIWRAVTWDDVTVASNLMTKGQRELENNLAASVSLTMRAFDLHILDVDTDSFQVGDLVRIVSLPHGVDDYFMCSEIRRDLINPGNSTFTFGAGYKTLTGQTRAQAQATNAEIQSIITTPPRTEIFKTSPSGHLWGDANGNGVVDSTDLNLISASLTDPSVSIIIDACDTNNSGTVTNSDYIIWLRLVPNLPAGKIIAKAVTTYSDGSTSTTWEYVDPD